MGQNVLYFDQKICLDQKTKLPLCFFLAQILLKGKRAESNQIKLGLFSQKKIKTFLKGQCRSNHIDPNSSFLKIFETQKN